MPSKAVPRTIGDFILYYYAKLVIATSSGESGNYRFIIDRYKRLKSAEIQMSDYDREIQKLAQQPDLCAFCGKVGHTTVVELVPRCFGGPGRSQPSSCLPRMRSLQGGQRTVRLVV